MGRASSSKKVARAARTAGRPGAGRNYGWPLAIGGVVVVGVLLVILSFGSNKKDNVPPTMTDHFHTAYGVYNCSTYLPPLSDAMNSGIHTHGEGLVHTEPRSATETGRNANVATFVKGRPGMAVTDTQIKIPGSIGVRNGDQCDGKPAKVRFFVWDNAGAPTPREVTGGVNRVLLEDQGAFAIAFVPDGVTPPLPPSVSRLQNPGESPTPPETTPSSAPVSVPPASTPETTAPPATTATTAKP